MARPDSRLKLAAGVVDFGMNRGTAADGTSGRLEGTVLVPPGFDAHLVSLAGFPAGGVNSSSHYAGDSLVSSRSKRGCMTLTVGRTQKAVAGDVGINPDTLYRPLSAPRKSFCLNAGSR